ncbi:Beta-arrestin-1 [Exaiptasia diaphana]|nr:Beta-arrestin-1 [Exaiptasia diaphana]
MENKAKESQTDEAAKRTGTRVFKKTSPSGKITTYLGKRDFIDHIDHIDPIDGVVLVDPEYVKDEKKVYAHVLAAFRYGREDLDVLGLTFRKDLFLATVQVYPPKPEDKKPMTRLQERLLKKLGANAYPFKFELPPGSPSSVTLQPAPGDTGKPCGVDYELKTFVAESSEEKPHKRDTVRLAIRKLTYAPERPQPQPFAEAEKDFMMSSYPLHVEASLDKGLYYHGETIAVNIHLSNRSSKTCKKVKITVRQFADICLFSTAQYKCPVAVLESEDGFPVGQSGTLSKVYCLTPLLDDNRDKRGLALDGKLKHEDTNLASSTTDLTVELPFMLTHPKPLEEPTPPPTPAKPPSAPVDGEANPEAPVAVDHNLIDFDTDGPERHSDDHDDLIFEDFARLRLKGTDLTETADA